MRAWACVAWVLPAFGLCGCLSTHHVEYNRAASTGVDTGGCLSCAIHATRDERHRQGPWLLRPDWARP
jgi:hypothetical protein